MKVTKFRTKYDPRLIRVSFRQSKSLTDRQFLADTSIEGIIRRYGVLPASEVKPVSADVSEYGDFAKCMERVQAGVDDFMALPSQLRARFGNDPKAFFEFLHHPENIPEAVKLGLMVERKQEKSVMDVLEEIKEGVTAKADNRAQ